MGDWIAQADGGRQAQARSAQTAGRIALLDLVATLWRRRGLVALIAAAVTGLAALALNHLSPVYSATTEIMLTGRAAFPTIRPDQRQAWDDADVQGEIRVLQSSDLLWPVARNLGLDQDPDFGAPADGRAGSGALSALRWTPPPRSTAQDAGAHKARVLSRFRKRLDVGQRKLSRVLAITIRAGDARLAALIANTLADAYISDRLDRKSRDARRTSAWLEDQVRDMNAQVASAEARLASLNAERAVAFGAARDADATQLASLSETLRRVRADLADPGLSARMGQALRDREAALSASVARLETQVASQAESDIELRRLTQAIKSAQTLRDAFLEQFQESRAVSGVQTPDARVISRADPPVNPAFPNTRLILAFAALAGLGLGAAVACLFEAARTPIVSPARLEDALDAPTLAALPEAGDMLSRLRGADALPDSAGARALSNGFDDLRDRGGGPVRVLGVLGAEAGQGASTTAAVLAEALAARGLRTVLVDCDGADPAQAERFGLEGAADLAGVLTGEVALDAAVARPAPEGDLAVLPSQPGGDVLWSGAWRPGMTALLARLAERFDVIILDLAPVSEAPESALLAAQADATLICARRHTASAQALTALRRRLDLAGAYIGGGVLTHAGRPTRKPQRHARYDRFQTDFAT